jgi:hypothetical protein
MDFTGAAWKRHRSIAGISHRVQRCQGRTAQLYGQGRTAQRIRFWDGYDKPTPTTQRFGQNLSDTRGRYIEYDSYHIWAYPTLLIHEELHAWLAENPDNAGLVSGPNGISNEEWVEQMAQGCTGPASGWQ